MTSMITKYISKRILGESLQNNFGQEDPYFETVPATRLNGRPSKKGKKRRKALPVGISEHDGKVLTKVKRRAYRLDMSLFNCCGIRFGWSSLIGIVPGIGDVIDAFMALMVLRTCEQIEGGLPSHIKAKMWFNIVLDFGIGLTPIIGDIADALFRANTRNAVVLEKYLREKGAKNLKAQGQRPPAIDPTDPEEFDRYEDEAGPPPPYTESSTQRGTQRQDNGNGRPAQPPRPTQERIAAREERGGWFSGFGSKKKKQPDVESGSNVNRREDAPLPTLPNGANGGSHQDQPTTQKTRR